jgi:hypothetical protein
VLLCEVFMATEAALHTGECVLRALQTCDWVGPGVEVGGRGRWWGGVRVLWM